MAALKAAQAAGAAATRAEADMRVTPGRAKPSADYLTQRRIEERLVKQV
jgi:hypothetical protein